MCIGEFQQSHPADALTFICPEVELAMIGGCRKIGQIERDGGAVKIDLAANAPEARPDSGIDRDGIGPCFGIVVAHMPPIGIGMERAADAGALGRKGIAMPLQPAQAIRAGHAPFDQGSAVDLPILE